MSSFATSSTTYHYKLAQSKTSTTVTRPRSYIYSVDYLKRFAGEVAIKYGLNGTEYKQMMAVLSCESSWDSSVWSKGKMSYGIAQFTKDTFKENCTGDYYNPLDQLECVGKMWSEKMYHRWDCFNNLFGK